MIRTGDLAPVASLVLAKLQGPRGKLVGEAPDAVVLDLGRPDVDGLEVFRRLRRAGDRVPILMLTARDAVADRIEGLDAGADDYLVSRRTSRPDRAGPAGRDG